MTVDLEAALEFADDNPFVPYVRDLVAECRRLQGRNVEFNDYAVKVERERDEARRQLAIAREALRHYSTSCDPTGGVAVMALAKIDGREP